MKIGDTVYGCVRDIDIFTEKLGYKRFIIRLRNEQTGELWDKKQVIGYSLKEALTIAEAMALTHEQN